MGKVKNVFRIFVRKKKKRISRLLKNKSVKKKNCERKNDNIC